MSTRLYHVKMKRKNVLVEARSKEQAVLLATKSMISSITIPTPMEAFKLKAEGAEIISSSIPSAEPAPESEPQVGGEVGRMGLAGGETEVVDEGGEHE